MALPAACTPSRSSSGRAAHSQRRHVPGCAAAELAAAVVGSGSDGRVYLQVVADVPALATTSSKQLRAFSGLATTLEAALETTQPYQKLAEALACESLLLPGKPLLWSSFITLIWRKRVPVLTPHASITEQLEKDAATTVALLELRLSGPSLPVPASSSACGAFSLPDAVSFDDALDAAIASQRTRLSFFEDKAVLASFSGAPVLTCELPPLDGHRRIDHPGSPRRGAEFAASSVSAAAASLGGALLPAHMVMRATALLLPAVLSRARHDKPDITLGVLRIANETEAGRPRNASVSHSTLVSSSTHRCLLPACFCRFTSTTKSKQ